MSAIKQEESFVMSDVLTGHESNSEDKYFFTIDGIFDLYTKAEEVSHLIKSILSSIQEGQVIHGTITASKGNSGTLKSLSLYAQSYEEE